LSGQGFVVIQIGDDQLDRVCNEAIFPALEDCGLEPRRVDKHTEGQLLKSEIVEFLREAEIVVADLTNERPNCYLEVGYAMGLGRHARLVLTARDDHQSDSPKHVVGGPKVHFDLSGYDILWWDENDLPAMRSELVRRVTNRLRLPDRPIASLFDESWIDEQRTAAKTLARMEPSLVGVFEVSITLHPSSAHWPQRELLTAAQAAMINRQGWQSLGEITGITEDKPSPTSDGIVARILHPSNYFSHPHYQYWSLRDNGDYYSAASLFEDGRQLREQMEQKALAHEPRRFYFDLAIYRVTEAFLYAVRLYEHLGVDPGTKISIRFVHDGLSDRELMDGTGRGSGLLPAETRCTDRRTEKSVTASLDDIEPGLYGLVRSVVEALFVLFNFARIHPDQIDYIARNFQDGRLI
jgi:hypothetical protein